MSKTNERYGVDVLAIAPHPDDAELSCGGTLLRLAELGYRTAIVDLTRGEMSTNGTIETRAAETEAASRILGLALRENLALPDTFLNADAGFDRESPSGEPRSQLVAVVELLRRLRPELLLVPWHADRHPDHRAASELLTRAVFFANLAKFGGATDLERFTPRQVAYYQLRERFVPSFIVDISSVAERKYAAARCYASQFGRVAGSSTTLINTPVALAALEARDRYHGAMLGVTHGEAFLCRNTLGLVDPLDHFRRNDFATPHLFESANR